LEEHDISIMMPSHSAWLTSCTKYLLNWENWWCHLLTKSASEKVQTTTLAKKDNLKTLYLLVWPCISSSWAWKVCLQSCDWIFTYSRETRHWQLLS